MVTKETKTFDEIQRLMQMKKVKGQAVNYSFRSAETIFDKFKELNSGWTLEVDDPEKSGPIEVGGRVFYKSVISAIKGDEIHSAAGYAESSSVPSFTKKATGDVIKQMSEPQWTGAVSSYARKYALQALFAIGEQDVDDLAGNIDLAEQHSADKYPPTNYERKRKYAKAIVEMDPTLSEDELFMKTEDELAELGKAIKEQQLADKENK